MAQLVIIAGNGTNAVHDVVPALRRWRIEAVNVGLDMFGSSNELPAEVVYRAASGKLIARSRSLGTVSVGTLANVTFAPNLPDTDTIVGGGGGYDVLQTGLADTPLPAGTRVTVRALDADAVIEEARLWVEVTVTPSAADLPNPVLIRHGG